MDGQGGAGGGVAIKEKKNFFWNLFFQCSKTSMAIKIEREGGG